jgi:hypothetical protein
LVIGWAGPVALSAAACRRGNDCAAADELLQAVSGDAHAGPFGAGAEVHDGKVAGGDEAVDGAPVDVEERGDGRHREQAGRHWRILRCFGREEDGGAEQHGVRGSASKAGARRSMAGNGSISDIVSGIENSATAVRCSTRKLQSSNMQTDRAKRSEK